MVFQLFHHINVKFNIIFPQILFRIGLMVVLAIAFSGIKVINAQNVKKQIDQAKALVEDKKYKEADRIYQNINESQISELGDSCLMLYNYGKGACLYFMDKYEEAIPILQKGIQVMDKLQKKDCDYLEMLYGIGACYKELKNYPKAEEYFRRTILKGNYFNLNCAIRNQTYREMAELYSLMGKPEFADICISRIESEMRLQGSKDLDSQLDALWDLYKAHYDSGKIEESINDLKKLRHLIKDNMGKNNIKYLEYSFLLASHLRYNCNRPQEAATIHKEMIEIGKQFKTYRDDICSAYIEYLSYLSENNKVDSIELILPTAVKYYFSTKDIRYEENLYEIVGNRLCDAGNYEEGIKYLEKKWKGQTANSIKALDYLGAYYFYVKNNAEKALEYYNKAQSRVENGLETTLGTKILLLERLVLINQRLGNSAEAIRYSNSLEPLIKQQNDVDDYSRFLVDWAVECVNSGNKEKAKGLADSVDALLYKLSAASQIRQYSQLAFICIRTEKYDKSIEYATHGIEVAIKDSGEKNPILATLYHNLGRAYMLKGDYSSALSALNKSKKLQLELEGEVMQRTADYIKECESK